MAKILVADDDAVLADKIARWLKTERHVVDCVHDGSSALYCLKDGGYELAVLDWEMPELTGVDVVRSYRSGGGSSLILMLTGRSTTQDTIRGLDAGADDYLAKPFEVDALLAKTRALLRRSGGEREENKLVAGNLTMDLSSRLVLVGQRSVQLTATEFSLLQFLVSHPNEVFSVDALLIRVWKDKEGSGAQAVRSCVNSLRQKLSGDEDQDLIRTVHGVGYRFVPER